MDNNYENDVFDVFDSREKKKAEIEERFQAANAAKIKSLNEERIEIKAQKREKVAKREMTKKALVIAMCASLSVAAIAGYNSITLSQALADNELEKINKTVGFSENIDSEYIAKNYPNYPYVAEKYISDIINYENNDKINKNIYYDEMIGYIFYYSKDVLDKVFSNMKSYIDNNECSNDLKNAFYFNNFDEYLKAHNFDSVQDYDRHIHKFLAERAKNTEENDKAQDIADEHNFTLDSQDFGGRK